MRARLLLAAIVFPAFTLAAQPRAGAATSDATPTARAGSARLGHADSASIADGRFDILSPYPTPGGIARAMYAEPREPVYLARRATNKRDASPPRQPSVSGRSGCWWLWVLTGMPVCW